MTILLKLIAYVGLALSIIPALMVFGGMISLPTYYGLMIVGMLMWFSTAIFWIKPDSLE